MRTAALCPTCATYTNAVCVLYEGSFLSNIDVSPGDSLQFILANIDTAISLKQAALGYIPENVANKSTNLFFDRTSNVKYPSAKAVYDWVTTNYTSFTFTPENVANKSTDGTFAANSDTLYPSQKATKTYVDASVVGLLDDRGNYDASSNLFPSTGGSGTAGAILKGDIWLISVSGTLGGNFVDVGYWLRALTNAPGQTSANWAISNVGLGYIAENQANKSTDDTFSANSDTLYPSQKAVKTYISNNVPTLQQVTTAGSLTNNNIAVNTTYGLISVSSSIDNTAAYLSANTGSGGYIGVQTVAGDSAQFQCTNITANRQYELPNKTGTLVLSVNNTVPDSFGNVDIPTGTSPFSYEVIYVTGTNSATANPITKTFTSLAYGSGNYVKLPATPTIGDIYYLDNADNNLNLFVDSGSNTITSAGTFSGTSLYQAGNETNKVYVFQYVGSSVWITWSLSSSKGYKVYSAFLNGTTPTVTVLENTLGIALNWSNPSNGVFRATASYGAPFTVNKTTLVASSYNNAGAPYFVTGKPSNLFPTTEFDINMFLHDGTQTSTPNVQNMFIEIRVYN